MSHAKNKRKGQEQMLNLLENAPDGLHVNELAESLGRDRSTIYRWLEECGIEPTTRGRFAIPRTQNLRNVYLHPSEALAVYLALRRFITQMNQAPSFMLSAIHKVIPALQHDDLIDNLRKASRALAERRPADNDHERIWQTLIDGWREQRVLRISYRKLDGTESNRDIEPYLFEPMRMGDGTYVIAWCRTRDDLRTFKVDRILRAHPTMDTFERRDLSIEQLIQHAWNIWYGKDPERVVLRFAPNKADRVMESVYHDSEEKERLPDGSLLWSVDVAATLELQHWILGWGAGVEVRSPPDLRDDIAEELRAAAGVYSRKES